MFKVLLTDFIAQYVPGFEWLVFLILTHVILSTIAHIKQRDFKISQWPGFLGTWLMFIVGIICVNGVISVSHELANANMLVPLVSTLQGFMYVIYFTYYLDNIFKHMSMLGLPVDPGLIECIKGMTGKFKSNIGGGSV